jgi:hypothetical protein
MAMAIAEQQHEAPQIPQVNGTDAHDASMASSNYSKVSILMAHTPTTMTLLIEGSCSSLCT